MTGRLPDYFGLDRFSISADDIVRLAFRCDPSRIHRDVLVTPIWSHETFLTVADLDEIVTPETVYSLRYSGTPVTLIRSGVGAPLTGDAILALACTPCARVVFVGSVGGLLPEMAIGDLIVASESVSGNGFSSYLPKGPLGPVSFLSTAMADPGLTNSIELLGMPLCRDHGASLTKGKVFSTDSIVAQFHHLEEIVHGHGCLGIEMETAAVFRAAALIGIPAAALLQISDVTLDKKSLFSGRTEADQRRRSHLRQHLLSRIALDALVAP